MENGLYYCDATQISLGFSDGYKIAWDRDKAICSFAEIVEGAMVVDKFGDEWTSVICAIASAAVPIKKFRYRHRSGDTGFEDFSKNESGHKPDKELRPLFDSILQDAWTWDHRKNKFICYADEKHGLNYPDEFFSGKAPKSPMISLHSPSAALIRQFSEPGLAEVSAAITIYNLQGMEKLKALLDLAGECAMVLIWQLGDGLNPIVVSAGIDEAVEKFGAWCVAESIPFKKIESEGKLPTW